MTEDEIIEEGRTLRRPCLFLSTEGRGPIVGYLGGERQDMPNKSIEVGDKVASRTHWFTIDSAIFAPLDHELKIAQAGRPLDMHKRRNIEWTMREFHDFNRLRSFDEVRCSGAPLYATPGTSFPPFEAVCLYGSERVAEWLRSEGLERHQYDAARMLTDLGDYYVQEYFELGAYFVNRAPIMIGGWHMLWPSNDFYMPREMRVLVTAVEPGGSVFEIWAAPGGTTRVREQVPGGLGRGF